jgi:hypothetical protein
MSARPAPWPRTARLSQLSSDKSTGFGNTTGGAETAIANLVRRDAYVLA